MCGHASRFARVVVVLTLFALMCAGTALASVTAKYRGKDVQNFEANATATFSDNGDSAWLDVDVATKGSFRYSGKITGLVFEGTYTAPPGFGGGSFKANLSTAPGNGSVPAAITVLHGANLQWPLQLTLVAAGNAGGGAPDDNPQLQASIACDPNPLVLMISELPGRTCTVWIGNWKRNTSAPVQVIAPQALDGYGNHANGIQIFGTSRAGTGIGVAPANMGGYRAPDGSYGTIFPWNLTVFACPAQQGTGANCFQYSAAPGSFTVTLVVHQDGARDAVVALNGTALARAGSGGAGNTGAATLFRIRNGWRPDLFINIEQGFVAASQVSPSWWSAQWVLEPVAGTQFVRIANRWKPDNYINIENGLSAGPAPAHWWSAMWSIEPVAGAAGTYRIRNRWKPDLFLNIESGRLQCTQIQAAWLSAMWRFDQ